MALGTIFTVLANVPWKQVIDAAPKVADGATRLWSSVTRRKADALPQEIIDSAKEAESRPAESPIHELQRQVIDVQTDVAQLKAEMESASELIKALADQNSALVNRIELNRKRVYRHTILLGAVAAVLLATVISLTLRQ